VTFFQRSKTTIQKPQLHQQFTTTSPQKTIHKHAHFPKHPSKTPVKAAKPRIAPGLRFFPQIEA
jgi:hypothetical protein